MTSRPAGADADAGSGRNLHTAADSWELLLAAINAHCAVCITDGAGRILHANDAFADIAGMPGTALLGSSFDALVSDVRIADARIADTPDTETPDTHTQGAGTAAQTWSDVWSGVSSGTAWRGRIAAVRSADLGVKWMDTTIHPHVAPRPEDTRCVILQSDLSPVTDLEMKLAKARIELAEMGKIQSNFLAAMSHDLRTPLNSIIGFTDIINQGLFGPVGNERYADYLESVNGSARHLLTLVNDILDFSIMEATGYKFQLERYDPVEQTKTVVRTFDWVYREKSLRIDVIGGDRAPDTVLADPRIATQIQTNLITNACRHSPEGGLVTVVWDRDDAGDPFLEVRNEGDPIPDEIIEGFGRPFLVRNPMHASNTEKSYGLGLYICHRFIEARGGKLVISRNNGVGAVVRATWPAAVLKPEPV